MKEERIEQYVEETIEAIVLGNFSIQSLKSFHRELNEKNRRAARETSSEYLDRESLQFMHQVTKRTMKAVGTRRRYNTQRARRSIRSRNSVVE